jgi:antitoxin component YwqK of YwqJK toxin-antitoxin module
MRSPVSERHREAVKKRYYENGEIKEEMPIP